ncbi:MAG: hypothetical protein KAT54_05935, partial [Candidatus Marinimicrobia bacterium]|nr:hypothetical protein [Candidatus Neomarinimicrobiota bacterium]
GSLCTTRVKRTKPNNIARSKKVSARRNPILHTKKPTETVGFSNIYNHHYPVKNWPEEINEKQM